MTAMPLPRPAVDSLVQPESAPTASLRHLTAARIGVGRAGGSLPTRELLSFGHDHALARDAVQAVFDTARMKAELDANKIPALVLESAAPDRAVFLRRPDLGRRLSEQSAKTLRGLRTSPPPDLVIVVSDGLSALAAEQQAGPLLSALLPPLAAAQWAVAPIILVHRARVALMDEVGAALGARLALILLGERPGLGTPDSLGAYLEFGPRAGLTNAERNCISNIRPAGLPPAEAAGRIFGLLAAARRTQSSGITLKEEDAAPLPAPAKALI